MKDEQVSVNMPRSVLGVDDFSDMDSIYEKITAYIESILPRINIEDLAGWRLLFYINCQCTDFIGVYKKFLWYPSDREYGILIVIPIPDNTQAPYGLPPGENGRISPFCRSASGRHSHLLGPEYGQYDSLDQYILASAIKAIDLGFTKGFTCYGKKIKFQDL